MLDKYISKEEKGVLSSNSNITNLQTELKDELLNNEKVTLDLKGVKAISPSFAYECFGKLYEDENSLQKLKRSLVFNNDNLNLGNKIIKAIDRRLRVIS